MSKDQRQSRGRSLARVCRGWLVIPALLFCLEIEGRRITDADRQHWAFQPLKCVAVPAPRDSRAQVQNQIDRFILSRLETNQLVLAPRATKEQLIRRVTLGLIGLPPTLEEIDAFVRDPAPDAYGRLIDRLLASPHYGERWGQHWLDLARFAESDGFEHDTVRPHAWRYREYVIRSFNADKPYDRFIREQLAGDELWANHPDALIATCFNLLGPDMVDSADQVQRRHNTLNDMTDTAALVFLGQTIGCARCHSHKSEPFSQRDYYQFQAFFTPAKFQRELPVPTAAERAAHEVELAKYNALTQSPRGQIEAIEAPHRAQLYAEKLAKLSEEARLAHQTPKEKRSVEMENQIQETSALLTITETELLKIMPAEAKARRKDLLAEWKKFPSPAPLPRAMALVSSNPAFARTFVLGRGDYNNPGDPVEPGFPEILTRNGDEPAQSRPEAGPAKGEADAHPASPQRGRAALAHWIAHAENPLTARVMVNRIWQHHFGRGIVPTPSEFGTRAQAPTHPELLDWLAREFVGRGWSIKQMHKLILCSATYQQSSRPPAEALARDPGNQWFSRQNRVRLEGEVIRDSLLAISGRLNRKAGGPGIFPPIPADIAEASRNWTASADPAEHARRSVYIFVRRNLRYPFLEVFDAPDNNLSCPERGRSTTAPQSLTLLNSEEVMVAARATAARVSAAADSAGERIERAFRLVIGRKPSPAEASRTHQFLGESTLEDTCRALFNLNTFLYVD